MEKRCKNCKYFIRENEVLYSKNENTCTNPHFKYTGDLSEINSDDLSYSDYEGYSADFSVGEDFGCIHFEEVEQ